MDYQLIATTTFGIEAVTARELKRLGYEDLKLENSIFNKYIQEIAKELHIKLEGLHKVNSATSEADAYYIYL